MTIKELIIKREQEATKVVDDLDKEIDKQNGIHEGNQQLFFDRKFAAIKAYALRDLLRAIHDLGLEK